MEPMYTKTCFACHNPIEACTVQDCPRMKWLTEAEAMCGDEQYSPKSLVYSALSEIVTDGFSDSFKISDKCDWLVYYSKSGDNEQLVYEGLRRLYDIAPEKFQMKIMESMMQVSPEQGVSVASTAIADIGEKKDKASEDRKFGILLRIAANASGEGLTVLREDMASFDDFKKQQILREISAYGDKSDVQDFLLEWFSKITDRRAVNFLAEGIARRELPFIPSLLQELFNASESQEQKDAIVHAAAYHSWVELLPIMESHVDKMVDERQKELVLEQIAEFNKNGPDIVSRLRTEKINGRLAR